MPTVCAACLGPEVAITMLKIPRGSKCKLCDGPVDLFKWQPTPKAPFKQTQICAGCSKAKHACPSCLRDFDFGLAIHLRDATIGAPEQSMPVLAVGSSLLSQLQQDTQQPSTALVPQLSSEQQREHRVLGDLLEADKPIQFLTHAGKAERLAILQSRLAEAVGPSGSPYGSMPAKEPSTIWLGHLSDQQPVTEKMLRDIFEPFGQLKAIRFNDAKACVFVEFLRSQAANEALQALGKSLKFGDRPHPMRLATTKQKPKRKWDR